MPLTTHLDIVSAEALIYSGPAPKVVLPAEAGELCVLARHAPLLTKLRPGLVRLANEFEVEQSFFISSGFVEVQPHIVTVLADTVMRTRDLDEEAARTAMERTHKAIAAQPSAADYDKLMHQLRMESALLRAIAQLRHQKIR